MDARTTETGGPAATRDVTTPAGDPWALPGDRAAGPRAGETVVAGRVRRGRRPPCTISRR
ncbi:hypothetical protein ACFQV4_31520 [Streptomyces thermocarboxydus]